MIDEGIDYKEQDGLQREEVGSVISPNENSFEKQEDDQDPSPMQRAIVTDGESDSDIIISSPEHCARQEITVSDGFNIDDLLVPRPDRSENNKNSFDSFKKPKNNPALSPRRIVGFNLPTSPSTLVLWPPQAQSYRNSLNVSDCPSYADSESYGGSSLAVPPGKRLEEEKRYAEKRKKGSPDEYAPSSQTICPPIEIDALSPPCWKKIVTAISLLFVALAGGVLGAALAIIAAKFYAVITAVSLSTEAVAGIASVPAAAGAVGGSIYFYRHYAHQVFFPPPLPREEPFKGLGNTVNHTFPTIGGRRMA